MPDGDKSTVVRLETPPGAPILKDARGRSLKSVELKEVIPPFLSMRVFEAAARSGSFARAAEELGITAGAVSQHIRVLEEFAGQPLFRRLGRGVELTEAGHAAFSHASAAMAEMMQAGRAMRASLRGTRISLSTAPSFA